MVPVRIYSDGSGYEGGIGASALLFINDRQVHSLKYYLATSLKHTVYKAKGVGLLMGLHLLHGLHREITLPTILGSDSQVAIRVLGNQKVHSGQYILDAIRIAAKHLHAKQDGLMNRAEHQRQINAGETWSGRRNGIVDLQVHWVPRHCDFRPNEQADKEAKSAVQGTSSEVRFLPQFLCKRLPLSVSALHQLFADKLNNRWRWRWKGSERENILCTIDNLAPLKKYL